MVLKNGQFEGDIIFCHLKACEYNKINRIFYSILANFILFTKLIFFLSSVVPGLSIKEIGRAVPIDETHILHELDICKKKKQVVKLSCSITSVPVTFSVIEILFPMSVRTMMFWFLLFQNMTATFVSYP